MKKVLFLVSVVMAVLSFQANAATLTWGAVSNPLGLASQLSPFDLNGQLIGLKNKVVVNDTWQFNLSADADAEVNVSSIKANPTWLKSVLLDGIQLTQNGGSKNGSWTFIGMLNAGMHTLSFGGTTNGRNSGYQANVAVAETPIPAALWLFGSGLLGLMGLTTRKNKA